MTPPKIDTQAPDTIHAAGERLLVEIDMLRDIASTPDASSICDELRQWVRARIDDRLASAAREAAAVERAFRDGLAYATNVRVKDHDQAWQQSLARERLGDTTALDRLIAERVREEAKASYDAMCLGVKAIMDAINGGSVDRERHDELKAAADQLADVSFALNSRYDFAPVWLARCSKEDRDG